MIRVPRLATATVTALALAVGLPELALASPDQPRAQRSDDLISPDRPGDRLPPGWELTGDGAERHLVWRAPKPVPMGDARVEFYAGDRLLGRPQAGGDDRTFRLKLDDGPGAREGLEDLRALAGGRRLDKPAPAAPPQRTVPVPERLPANGTDPGKPGPYRTVKGEYDLAPVKLPGFPRKVEMRATVTGPVGAPGKRPVALFLHGRHGTCYKGGDVGGNWPCESGWKPVPSYQGYLHDQKLLASQGYVTVSVSANGINGQDDVAADGGAQARSSLVRRHLGRFADWAADPQKAPAAVRDSAAAADLSRVLLVGHSRGGEGVNRAALDSRYAPPADQDGYPHTARWQVRGTVLIGPTVFGQNPDPDVPSLTLLPGCDGDVSDLQGQLYLDNTRGVGNGSALHSAAYMVGANHNYFNTEWTPGQAQAPANDDFGSDAQHPVCSPGSGPRLTAEQQQKAGSTYIAAAAQLFVGGDDAVRPLLDGSGRSAPSANPARVLTHAVGGRRTAAVVPDPALKVTGGTLCDQTAADGARACLKRGTKAQSPHFAGFEATPDPGRYALAMRWSRAGATMSVKNPRPVSLDGSTSLALRVALPPNSTGTKLDVTAVDASGRRAKLGQVRADGLPGSGYMATYWGQELRVPLTAATRAGLDLKRIQSLELTSRTGSGHAVLMDAWGWRPGTAEVRPSALARVDVGQPRVDEGDSGVRTHRVPVRVTGDGEGKVRLWVPSPDREKFTVKTVSVRPGDTSLGLPFKVKGNKRYGMPLSYSVLAKTAGGAVVGSYSGGLSVREDDPMPKVTVKPVAAKVTEGKPLTWRVSLSAAADTEIVAAFRFERVSGGKELSTKDVDKAWLKRQFDAKPDPARPLSKVTGDPFLSVVVPAGKRSADLVIPTVKDRVRESQESVRVRLYTYDQDWNEHRGPLFTGRVRNGS
ncbi:hypothetical protein GCM10018785_14690 [Streptomyces longispororuber]|uniref:Secreted protein n=1 Tax=Streptomyces longispororuber TaxID=68230 RepID=A0A919DHY4_9ACTN|nr:hypothetical protein GCM10018785_14690 [Streptomyces longispororuber]